ncbi:hypothetical protein PVK06_036458 [Gossypium arboreum]|uniref:Uncharacterized protein n=1 Tax=Gossypium arboreum TaxID=29729 RepID=A0ABR0NJL2_GOSAR|nr:hypothetical protein PVK06_036458 [Gossypium arboreum]
MVNYLAAGGIRLPNFAYHFEIVNGERRLSISSEGFILSLYLLEADFPLPLHPFFYTVIEEYRTGPGQLTSLSWWTLVPYFLSCNIWNEPPMIGLFQRFYRLKAGSSSYKRSRSERDSFKVEEGSGNRLTCHRPGKELIFSESESPVPPSAIPELPTEFVNAEDPPTPTSTPFPAGLGLSTPCQTSHTPLISAPITLLLQARSKPSSLSVNIRLWTQSWTLQKACVENEAKWAESERTIFSGEQSLSQLHQSYEAFVCQNNELTKSVSTWETKYQQARANLLTEVACHIR